VLALAAGLWLASFDARTDDTGVEAALIFAFATVLAAVRPRLGIFIALVVGGLIPIGEAVRGGGFPAGIVALGVSVAGALLGAYLGTIARRTARSSA
jgi:hypothetical protein